MILLISDLMGQKCLWFDRHAKLYLIKQLNREPLPADSGNFLDDLNSVLIQAKQPTSKERKQKPGSCIFGDTK